MLKITMLLAIIMCAPRSYRCYELLNSSIPACLPSSPILPHCFLLQLKVSGVLNTGEILTTDGVIVVSSTYQQFPSCMQRSHTATGYLIILHGSDSYLKSLRRPEYAENDSAFHSTSGSRISNCSENIRPRQIFYPLIILDPIGL